MFDQQTAKQTSNANLNIDNCSLEDLVSNINPKVKASMRATDPTQFSDVTSLYQAPLNKPLGLDLGDYFNKAANAG